MGLRKQFINNSVFPTLSCGAGFRDDNNNNNSLCCTRSIGAPCDLLMVILYISVPVRV